MRHVILLVALASATGGCVEALEEVGEGGWSCETRNPSSAGGLVGGPLGARSASLDLDAGDEEDGEAITFLVLRAFGNQTVGSATFFARGPHGAAITIDGAGNAADPWQALVAAPPFGAYEWGVDSDTPSVFADLRLSAHLQSGSPGRLLCPDET